MIAIMVTFLLTKMITSYELNFLFSENIENCILNVQIKIDK